MKEEREEALEKCRKLQTLLEAARSHAFPLAHSPTNALIGGAAAISPRTGIYGNTPTTNIREINVGVAEKKSMKNPENSEFVFDSPRRALEDKLLDEARCSTAKRTKEDEKYLVCLRTSEGEVESSKASFAVGVEAAADIFSDTQTPWGSTGRESIQALEVEVQKLCKEADEYETRLRASQGEVGKDKADTNGLEGEVENLRFELEASDGRLWEDIGKVNSLIGQLANPEPQVSRQENLEILIDIVIKDGRGEGGGGRREEEKRRRLLGNLSNS